MVVVITVEIRNGLPGYSDTETEYMNCDHLPNATELNDFVQQATKDYTHVQYTKTFITDVEHMTFEDYPSEDVMKECVSHIMKGFQHPPATTDVEVTRNIHGKYVASVQVL